MTQKKSTSLTHFITCFGKKKLQKKFKVTEAATDPELSAWFDGDGKENADKCAWTYGTTWNVGGGGGSKGKNSSSSAAIPGAGGVANAKVGGRDFLLQLNWANRATRGYCDNK